MADIARVHQDGNRVDYTPSGAVAAGTIVVVEGRVLGVATSDIAANQEGSLDCSYGRIYEITLDAALGGSGVVANGDIFATPAGDIALTSNSGANPKFGQALAAYTSAATKILVRAMFVFALMAGTVSAQNVICEDGNCAIESSAVIADLPHVRCLVGNSCGSGTICGTDGKGAWVLSNAHVWGTQLGKQVIVDCVSNGARKRVAGRLVFTGYSNSRMVDFAIAYFEGLTSQRYMQILKVEPEDSPYQTTGCPRCVWPQVTKPFNDARNYGPGLITGLPDAIGGQSGSAIYNSEGEQIALLTWSINGRCAGQKTAKLWQVATTRNVLLADPRPEGLTEINTGDRPETAEGIFGSFSAGLVEESQGSRPITENVIASVVVTMDGLPIWTDGKPKPEPPKPDEPKPQPPADDCYKLSPKEWELIEFLRKQQKEMGAGRERAFDWVAILKLVMELIALIQQGRG